MKTIHLCDQYYPMGAYGACGNEPVRENTMNITEVTCKRCLQWLAKQAKLNPDTPTPIIIDRLLEMGRIKHQIILIVEEE